MFWRRYCNKDSFLSLIEHEGKKSLFDGLKKLAKSYKPGENKREIERNRTLRVLSEDAFRTSFLHISTERQSSMWSVKLMPRLDSWST